MSKRILSDIEKTRRRLKKEGKDVKVDFVLVSDEKNANPEAVVRILDNDSIRKLYNRGTITLEQFEAAEKLYSDWYNGGMSPRLVKPFKIMQIDEGSPELNESEFREYCNKRYNRAIEFIRSRSIIVIVQEVIIKQNNVTYTAKKFCQLSDIRYARTIINDRLKTGLSDLIEFYKDN